MKVDMSPKAVTQRLKIMDQLWVLSVKLMNAGMKLRDQKRPTDQREAEVKDSTPS